MILKSKESLVAYHCPYCGAAILSMVGIFRLTGDLIKLKCDCGESEMLVTKLDNDRVKLTIPCMVCPNPHVYTVSLSSFFTSDLIALDCPMTGLSIGFIGNEDRVRAELDNTAKEFLDMLAEAGIDDFDALRDTNDGLATDEAELSHLARFVISELIEDNAIECECPDDVTPDYDYLIEGETITIFCHKCLAEHSFPAATQTQLEDFAMTDFVQLERRVDDVMLDGKGEDE